MLFIRTVIVNIRTDTVVFTRLQNNTWNIELANCACVRIITFTSVATEIVRVRACAVVETWRLAARYENFTVHSSVVERATTGVGRKGVAVEAGSVVHARFLGARDSCFANTTCELAVANTGVVLKGWLFKNIMI